MGKSESGFTLIELMVVIALVAILGAIAIPSYQSSIANNRVSAEVDRVAMDMSYARSEAVKRGIPVSVCPSTGCAASSNWDQGWIVFQDDNGDLSGFGTATTANGKLLKQESPFSGKDTLVPETSLGQGVTFDRNGYTKASGKLILADSTGTTSFRRCIKFATGSWTRLVGAAC